MGERWRKLVPLGARNFDLCRQIRRESSRRASVTGSKIDWRSAGPVHRCRRAAAAGAADHRKAVRYGGKNCEGDCLIGRAGGAAALQSRSIRQQSNCQGADRSVKQSHRASNIAAAVARVYDLEATRHTACGAIAFELTLSIPVENRRRRREA